MNITRHAIALLALMLPIVSLPFPSIASAQLSAHERVRAQEVARIQAKADADERAKERRRHLDSAQSSCRSSNRQWDYANDTCKPFSLLSPR